MPPVSPVPTETYRVGKFVWFDLVTDDVPAARRFYGDLFGWTFAGDDAYTVISNQDQPIGGIAYLKRTDQPRSEARWIGALSVADVDQAVAFVLSSGGVIHEGPEDLPDRGRFAVISDPQGAVAALVRAAGGDPTDSWPVLNDWIWVEIWTVDPKASRSFYSSLVGYQQQTVKTRDNRSYQVFMRDQAPRAGIVQIPWKGVETQWLPVVRVEDPAALVARVQALGGRVILAPDDELSDGSVAIIADPSGAVLMVDNWPGTGKESQCKCQAEPAS